MTGETRIWDIGRESTSEGWWKASLTAEAFHTVTVKMGTGAGAGKQALTSGGFRSVELM